jgi:hypothetical protein
MRRFGFTTLILIMPVLTTCLHYERSAGNPVRLQAQLLAKGIQGGRFETEPCATWIDTMDDLRAIRERLYKSSLSDARERMPAIDFSQQGVLLVEMGQRPTGGYRLDLDRGPAIVSDGKAAVTLSWIEPSPGAILPQFLTSPWILIALYRGDYSLIDVLDQDGRVRVQVNVK